MSNLTVSFTQIPNIIFDEFQVKISDSELSLLMVIGRKTLGFHKEKDKIALSTFEKYTGKARDTVIRALKRLEGDGYIYRDRTTTPHSYQFSELILSNEGVEKQDVEKSNRSSIVKPNTVELSNQRTVVNSNTQKNTIKKTRKNTTTSNVVSADFQKICNKWNELFDNTLNEKDENLKKLIINAMEQFSVDQLIQAMFYRSKAYYYQSKAFHLRNKPDSFFGYPETIANDLRRKPENIFTYNEMVDKVYKENLIMDRDFQIIEGFEDENGKKLWEYKGL